MTKKTLPLIALVCALGSPSAKADDLYYDQSTNRFYSSQDLLKTQLRAMITRREYDCQTVDFVTPHLVGEGYTVSCNSLRYKFEVENHGGQWSVWAH